MPLVLGENSMCCHIPSEFQPRSDHDGLQSPPPPLLAYIFQLIVDPPSCLLFLYSPSPVAGSFEKGVSFDSNGARFNGGAFSVINDATLTFNKPEVVRVSDNFLYPNDFDVRACAVCHSTS